jgi:hypothetical protein
MAKESWVAEKAMPPGAVFKFFEELLDEKFKAD